MNDWPLSPSLYYGPDGEPLGLWEWAELFERRHEDLAPESWWRKLTELGAGLEVSTVWLGIDHNFLGGPPLTWETMVFGHDREEEGCWRYATRAEAFDDHERIVRELRAGVKAG